MASVSPADWPGPAASFQTPSRAAAGRRTDIDTLRAMACIALVSYHVVGSTPSAGLELPYDHWLSMLNRTPMDLRMPLFSFISGLVFVAIPSRGAGAAVGAKARRLLLPMLCVGALFWGLRGGMGIDQQPLWSIPFLPYEHYWFLQSTFLLMAVMLGLTQMLGGRDRLAAGLIGAGAAVLWLVGPRAEPDLMSLNGAIKLGPFFCGGYLAARWPLLWSWRSSPLGAIPAGRGIGLGLLAAVLLAGSVLAVLPDAQGTTWRRAMTLWIGGAGCLALVLVRPRSRALARLGRQSYAIYLFHVFFTAGLRELCLATFPHVTAEALWLPCLALGLAGPVLVARMAAVHPLSALLFLGVRLRRRAGRGTGALGPVPAE